MMELRVGRKFRVEHKIGAGNNAEIYHGFNVHTGEDVAMKLEPVRKRSPHLTNERKFYQSLGKKGTDVL
jgi:hypothetical protein